MDIVLGVVLVTAFPFLWGFFLAIGWRTGELAIWFGKQLAEKYL